MTYTVERARHAALRRRRPPEDPEVVDALRDLRAARAEDYARELIESWPPLTHEQRSRIAALLAPSTEEGAAA